MPSNFRTYEAQSRLLAAVIASSPAMRLNFKDIAKYFGESTPMGIEFQFRSIRKEARALRDAVDKGESPLSTRRTGASPAVRKRRTPAASTVLATPRKRARTAETVVSNEEESVTSEVNYDDLDLTPVSTPARHVAAAAAGPSGASGSPVIDLDATPETTFAPDATPALSVGATPTDASPETAYDEYHTAPRTQNHCRPQQQSGARKTTFSGYSMAHFDDDDDEDDDVFIVDTPSKVPKMEAVAAADTKPRALSPPQPQMSTNTTTVDELDAYSLGSGSGSGSWDTLSQDPSQSHAAFSFDSRDAWTQPDFFNAAESVPSFAQATSFYDDDAAI